MNYFVKLFFLVALSFSVIFSSVGMGYASEVHPYSMWLKQGESFDLEQYLSVNESITAGCNEDCFDVDLILYDATKKEVVYQDIDANTNPKITAPYDGDFVVNLLLPNCSLSRGCKVWLDLDEEG